MPHNENIVPISLHNIEIVDIKDEHIEQVADAHLQAFPGYLNSQIGKGYIVKFIQWFSSSDQATAICAVNINTNRVQGYLVGAPLGYTSLLTRHIFWSAFWGAVFHPWVFFKPQYFRVLMARLGLFQSQTGQSLSPKLPFPTMSLVGIGVIPSARGQNIGQALGQMFEERAIAQGVKSLRLSVYPDNAIACNLYKKMGWKPYSESKTSSGAIYYYKVLL